MTINWPATFERIARPALPLMVHVATLENESLYVGDQETWHFNTLSAWRLRDGSSLIAGWTWPNASDLVWELCGLHLVTVTPQSSRTPVDPVLIFDNGRSLEVFGDHYLDPWTLHLPTGILVGDGGL
jgi:hypothetical protein